MESLGLLTKTSGAVYREDNVTGDVVGINSVCCSIFEQSRLEFG